MPSCAQLSPLLFVIMIFFGSVTSCGLSGNRDNTEGKEAKGEAAVEEQESEKVGSASMRVVGEIVSVHAAEKFVLIKRYAQAGGFGPATLVASLGSGGGTCSLVLTGEQLGRYYAADIQEGTPSEGDVVVIRQFSGGVEAPSGPIPRPPQG